MLFFFISMVASVARHRNFSTDRLTNTTVELNRKSIEWCKLWFSWSIDNVVFFYFSFILNCKVPAKVTLRTSLWETLTYRFAGIERNCIFLFVAMFIFKLPISQMLWCQQGRWRVEGGRVLVKSWWVTVFELSLPCLWSSPAGRRLRRRPLLPSVEFRPASPCLFKASRLARRERNQKREVGWTN